MNSDELVIQFIVWSFAVGITVLLLLGIVQIVRLMLGGCS